jgi:hypothetical protein
MLTRIKNKYAIFVKLSGGIADSQTLKIFALLE